MSTANAQSIAFKSFRQTDGVVTQQSKGLYVWGAWEQSSTVIVLDMAIDGELTIPCDRCLDDMIHHVDTTYHLTVKAGERLDDSRDNVLEVPSNWKELDLAPIVRDTVLLTIPIMHTHDDPEQCNPAMMETLLSHKAHEADDLSNDGAGDEIDPRWAALKSLKEK